MTALLIESRVQACWFDWENHFRSKHNRKTTPGGLFGSLQHFKERPSAALPEALPKSCPSVMQLLGSEACNTPGWARMVPAMQQADVLSRAHSSLAPRVMCLVPQTEMTQKPTSLICQRCSPLVCKLEVWPSQARQEKRLWRDQHVLCCTHW